MPLPDVVTTQVLVQAMRNAAEGHPTVLCGNGITCGYEPGRMCFVIRTTDLSNIMHPVHTVTYVPIGSLDREVRETVSAVLSEIIMSGVGMRLEGYRGALTAESRGLEDKAAPAIPVLPAPSLETTRPRRKIMRRSVQEKDHAS